MTNQPYSCTDCDHFSARRGREGCSALDRGLVDDEHLRRVERAWRTDEPSNCPYYASKDRDGTPTGNR